MNSREIEDLKGTYCNSEKWSEKLTGLISDPGPSEHRSSPGPGPRGFTGPIGTLGKTGPTGPTGPVGPQAYCEICAHKRVCMYRKDIKVLISKGAIISCRDRHINGVQGEKGCR